jgi:hypothetical protein
LIKGGTSQLGYRKHCKQLFVIKMVDDDEDDDFSPPDGKPTISLHALIGIQPRTRLTSKIIVTINGMGLLMLLDTGSTHNFIDTDKATRVGVVLAGSCGLCVAVANGDMLISPGCCHDMKMMVHGEVFHIDCCDVLPLSKDG